MRIPASLLAGCRASSKGYFSSEEPAKGVVHKVEEKGTEAAAATGVDVGATSEPMTQYFAANIAFLFTIQDDLTGTLLFMGRVADPSAGPE